VKIFYNLKIPGKRRPIFYLWSSSRLMWLGYGALRISTSTGDQEYALRLDQTFQEIRGRSGCRGREVAITEALLAGTIEFYFFARV